MLRKGQITEIWEVESRSPLYNPIKSIAFESGDKISLSLEESISNNNRAYRVLKWGELYYNFTCMHI